MALVYITGIAGSGKTTVLDELKKRGYEVHDADENLSSWENKTTRKRVSASDHRLTTDPDFFQEHDWYIDKSGVKALAEDASDKTIFLGGSVANDDEVWGLFDSVFCLCVDDKTLEERIAARAGKDFGKSKHEMAHLLKLNDGVRNKYAEQGAVLIDSTTSPKQIADKIEGLISKS